MVYFRRYVSSQPRGFHLVSFQETKRNEKKKQNKRINEKKTKNYKKHQLMKMNKMKSKVKQNENKIKINKIKK